MTKTELNAYKRFKAKIYISEANEKAEKANEKAKKANEKARKVNKREEKANEKARY